MGKIYDIRIKRGMQFRLKNDDSPVGAKAGDIVKVTSVTAMGSPSDGRYNDYEKIRISNGKYSWRVDRSYLEVL